MSDEQVENALVGVVLVSHSREVAEAAAHFALTLATGPGAPRIATAGGTGDGGVGTSSELIIRALQQTDAGAGVVAIADLGSAVHTVRTLLNERGGDLPKQIALLDAPFLEGTIAAVAACAEGRQLTEVVEAAQHARNYRKL